MRLLPQCRIVVLKDHVLGSLFPGTAQFCLVLRALAERADLNDFSVVVQVNQTETLADDQDMAVPEYFLDLFGVAEVERS